MDLDAQTIGFVAAFVILLVCRGVSPGRRFPSEVRTLLVWALVGGLVYPLALCLFMSVAGGLSSQGHFWVRFWHTFGIYARSAPLDAGPRGAALGFLIGLVGILRGSWGGPGRNQQSFEGKRRVGKRGLMARWLAGPDQDFKDLPMNPPRVLNIGQCGFDHGSISRHLSKTYGAIVAGADTKGQAMVTLRAGDFELVLVNRVLDADGSSGLDLIRAIKADPALARVPVMLVSNFPEAQAEARTLGALPGFGKADLRAGGIPALDSLIGQPEPAGPEANGE